MAEQVVRDTLGQKIVLHTVDGSNMPVYIAANGRCRRCNGPVLQFPIMSDPPSRRWWWRLLPLRWDNALAQRAAAKWAARGTYDPPENACKCETPAEIPLVGPKGSCKGRTLTICGAGPSLAEAKRRIHRSDEVWGCNRAANWLCDKGWKITHAVSIDPSDAMYKEAWGVLPDVDNYMLATSVDPHLANHVLETLGERTAADGKPRRLEFFHSIRGGFPGELDLYRALFKPGPLVGRGLNSVGRCLELALWLGYDRIYLAGADHCLGPDDQMYAGNAKGDVQDPEAICTSEPIGGRVYRTRPDMLMSARALAEEKAEHAETIHFVGSNSLPRAMYEQEKATPGFLKRCVQYESEYAESCRTA